MSSKSETKLIIVAESVTSSIIKDAGTFALFAGLLYFNHKVLDGSGWIDMAFIVIVLLWLASRNSKSVFKGSADEAIKWLKDKETK